MKKKLQKEERELGKQIMNIEMMLKKSCNNIIQNNNLRQNAKKDPNLIKSLNKLMQNRLSKQNNIEIDTYIIKLKFKALDMKQTTFIMPQKSDKLCK